MPPPVAKPAALLLPANTRTFARADDNACATR